MMQYTIRHAREGFKIAGRGCIIANMNTERRYATVGGLTRRLDNIPEAKMLLTAIGEAVETYHPEEQAVLVLETEHAIQVLILGPEGLQEIIGGIDFLSENDLAGFRRQS